MARRRHSSRRHRRRGGSTGFLYKLLSVLAICVAVVVALTLFFRVDHIQVEGAERYSVKEVRAATGVKKGDNLILMNKPTVVRDLQEQLPYVEYVRISRKLPDTLVIELEECSRPMGIVQDGSVWLISPRGKGKIVDQRPAEEAGNYALIDGCELLAPSVGTPLALATEYATQQENLLELVHALSEAKMIQEVNAIHLEDLSVLRMDYAGRFRVELPYGADFAYKLRALNVVIEKLETNQTGTIQMLREDGRINFIED